MMPQLSPDKDYAAVPHGDDKAPAQASNNEKRHESHLPSLLESPWLLACNKQFTK